MNRFTTLVPLAVLTAFVAAGCGSTPSNLQSITATVNP